MRDTPPFLVLSPANFNDRTSLVIGLPMTTAEYNSDNPFAISLGKARRLGKAIRSLPPAQVFRLAREGARAHEIGKIDEALFPTVRERLNQIIQLK